MKLRRILAAACAVTLLLGMAATPEVAGEMKLALTAHAASSSVAIDKAHFPDANFRAYVSDKCDTDNDSKLSAKEINAVDSIDVSENDISSLKGIEYFTQLTDLRCDECPLTTLDLRKNTQLEGVLCQSCGLKELYVSGLAQLEEVFCDVNKLTELDFSGCVSLKNVYCYNNELTSIDIKDCVALDEMECGLNKLTSLDISGCPELRMLHCHNNDIKELDVSGSHLLDDAYKICCYYNYDGSGAYQDNTYAEGALHYYNLPYAGGGCFSADKDVKIITNKNVTVTDMMTNVSATGELCSAWIHLFANKAEVKNAELAFDITLKGGAINAPELQPHGKITISIPYKTKGLYVYHIKDGGTKEYIEAKYVDGCYVFTTDYLSVYALMKDKPTTKPHTHKYDSGKVTKAATYGATGVKTYTCTVCGAKKTSSIAKKTVKKLTAKTTYTCTTNAVRINWNKLSGVTGYKIFRYDDAKKKWVAVKAVYDPNATNYKISGLKAGKVYKFRVKAFVKENGKFYFGESCSTISTATRPNTTTVTKANKTSSAVRLFWKKTTCTGYRILRYDSAKKKWVRVTAVGSSATTQYKISGLKKNTTYKFKVQPYVKVGSKVIDGAASAVFTVKTSK